jgi:hypothetical protein
MLSQRISYYVDEVREARIQIASCIERRPRELPAAVKHVVFRRFDQHLSIR